MTKYQKFLLCTLGDTSEVMSGMDTYLRRTYEKCKLVEKENFPFWDYRSRRGPFSSSNSSSSSGNSSCDGSSVSSMSSSSKSDTGSEIISISEQFDNDSLLPCEQQKMTIQFLSDANEISSMEEFYQPIVSWIDPDLQILKITDKLECSDKACMSLPEMRAQLPSMAIMVFVQERGALGFERIQSMKRHFEKNPWKFHHSEHVHRGAINPYPYNSQDFYYITEDLPLCAVRQVHTGKEFFRTVLFVSDDNWLTMIQFYKLILDAEPDMKRDDFCLFTVSLFHTFDIQLALKKLQGDTKPRVLGNVRLMFRINDVRNIVSLLPKVCKPLSDTRWETSDNDGNIVVLETPLGLTIGSFSDSDRSSLLERGSITGRSSSENESSFSSQRRLNDNLLSNSNCRSSVQELKQRGAVPDQYSSSRVRYQTIIDNFKVNNEVYSENTVKSTKQIHYSSEENNDLGHNFDNQQSMGRKSNMNKSPTEGKPSVIKSFYV